MLAAPARAEVARETESSARLLFEIGAQAESAVDARLTKRLVALEVADVDVPPPPGVTTAVPLYYRVLAESGGYLRVELWELGKAQGARRISSEGTAQLEARRIALAAGELARQLRRRRLQELEALSRPKAQGREVSGAATEFPIKGRLLWAAAARGAAIGGSGALVVGPVIGTALRFSGRQTLSLHAAWLAGDAPELAGSSLRWIEAGLGVSQGFSLSPRLELHLGLGASAASVHAASTDDWSARAGLEARLAWAATRHFNVTVGPDVGATLHAVRDDRGGKLGGFWMGVTLGVELQP